MLPKEKKSLSTIKNRNEKLREMLNFFLIPVDILLALLLYATIALQIIFICVHFNVTIDRDGERTRQALAIYFLLLGLPLLYICLHFQCNLEKTLKGCLLFAARHLGLLLLLPINILMMPLVLPITALEKSAKVEMRSNWVLPHPQLRWWMFLTLEGAMLSFVGMGSYASQNYNWSSYSENAVDSLAIFTSTLSIFALPLMSLRLRMNCEKVKLRSYFLDEESSRLILPLPQ